MSFVFYDTETTGTDTAFCQILQFGAILTDDDLNILERFEIRSQLLPHIVPAPGAMEVTGLTAKQLTDPTLPTHYQMVCAIRDKLRSWSPAIFLGYNSLTFDEILLRQAFYQTLHPIYLTNTDGNARLDVLKMLQAASLFTTGIFKFPLADDGRQIFKLDQVAPLNGFAHEHAHDAMADVEATIHLCRMLRDKAPELFASFIKFSQKAAVSKYAFENIIFSLSEFYFSRPYSWLVTAFGVNPDNNTSILAFDLANDPNEFADLSHDQLVKLLKQSPKPVRTIKSNAAPIMMAMDAAPDIVEAKALGMEELLRRANVLKSDTHLCDSLIAAYVAAGEPEEPSPYVEEQIYQGFYTPKEQKRIEAFHQAPWEERVNLLPQFDDNRVKQLAHRLIYFERPDLLDDDNRRDYDIAIAKRLLGVDEDAPWLTLQEAIQELDDLLANADKQQKMLLNEHRAYLIERLEKAYAIVN